MYAHARGKPVRTCADTTAPPQCVLPRAASSASSSFSVVCASLSNSWERSHHGSMAWQVFWLPSGKDGRIFPSASLRTSPLPTVIHLQSASVLMRISGQCESRLSLILHRTSASTPLQEQCRPHGMNLDGYSCRNSSGIPPDSLAPSRLSHLQGYLNRRQSYNKSKRSVCLEGKI